MLCDKKKKFNVETWQSLELGHVKSLTPIASDKTVIYGNYAQHTCGIRIEMTNL